MFGKLGSEGNSPINGSKFLLNMTFFRFIFVIVGLGNMLVFLVPHIKSSTFNFGSMLPTPFSVVDMFKISHSIDVYYDNPKPSFMSIVLEPVPHQYHFVSNHDTHFMSLMGDT